ncbi:MAG TPA: redox-sensing transcriptional repressor Rex [Methylomusa anaerophila]|uniref:Redox-sensing transcriptional repressor Rex n=1 Tax=Methylomusa anaerophila TaxID=1930071 RepID=A0A348AE90_9FIRM|nr:redox-sensing transcriptional repressor Rex [Methylomusa anaerophila]BBB89388.1 redox-sensing transcriptional repressor Rex [Methylomusa anaerophila]HML90466.1 redox-sensing transcriptional repressor Rex [Methylomusa anaerophila]
MKARSGISKLTINRMVIYYNTLKNMLEEGVEIFISTELGRRTGIGPSLIRRDLCNFGDFGTRGMGYRVESLMEWIGAILGYDAIWNIAVVGEGLPSLVLSHYYNFLPPGFQIKAAFDLDDRYHNLVLPDLGLAIEGLEKLNTTIRKKKITIGLVVTGPQDAQPVTNRLIEAGISGIANFSPVPVMVPDNIALTQINLSTYLSQLSYDLSDLSPEGSPQRMDGNERRYALG